jgi:hypothetical protein
MCGPAVVQPLATSLNRETVPARPADLNVIGYCSRVRLHPAAALGFEDLSNPVG